MIRVFCGRNTEYAVAKCDDCGAEHTEHETGPIGEVSGWTERMATLHATHAGWTEKLDGRMLRLYCPDCAPSHGNAD